MKSHSPQFPDHPDYFGEPRFARRSIPQPLSAAAALRTSFQQAAKTALPSLVGLAAVLVGVASLHFNERWVVTHRRSLEEGRARLITPSTADVVFKENDGKLVLISGHLNVPDPLEEPAYGISVKTVRLRRAVQMFQWQETEDPGPALNDEPAASQHDHGDHGERSYSYYTDWFDKPIDSEAFDSPMGHHNPEEWPLNASTRVNGRVKIGGFLLGEDLKALFDDFSPFTSDERPTGTEVKMHAGLYYHAEDVWRPEVGDVRVQFSFAGSEGEPYTVVGRQAGREIRPYEVRETGAELLLLQPGVRAADEAFGHESQREGAQAAASRAAGWFLILIGLILLSVPLSIALSSAPSLVSVIRVGHRLPIPLSLSFSLTLFATGSAWLFYRPLIAVSSVLAAISPFLFALAKSAFRRQQHQRM